MEILAVVIFLPIALVFLLSGIMKLFSFRETAIQFVALGIPRRVAIATVVIVSMAEIFLPLMLLFGVGDRRVLLGALILLTVVFVAITLYHAYFKTGRSCACFGAMSTKPIGWQDVYRNCGLFLAVTSLLLIDLRWGPRSYFNALDASAWLSLLAVLVSITSLLLSVALLRMVGDIQSEIGGQSVEDAVEDALLGKSMELEGLKTSEGQPMRIEGLLKEDIANLILFTSPDCDFCADLISQLELTRADTVNILEVMILNSHSEPDMFKDLSRRPWRVSTILASQLHSQLPIAGTPSALIVDKESERVVIALLGSERITEFVSNIAAREVTSV